MSMQSPLAARALRARLGRKDVLTGLDLALPPGGFTIVIGPNASGKSTLLRTLARLHEPSAGQVLLEGRAIADFSHRERARRLSVLPQISEAPEGITVAELVSRGRHPHRGFLQAWSADDRAATAAAMAAAGVADLAARPLEELSGGQRQKAWIAMALAQEAGIMLLDEPTTYLDLAHQIEVLELCRTLNHAGRTIVAVLHELNHACRYATHLVVMKEGRIHAQGEPREIVTETLIETVFGIPCLVMTDPVSATPMVVPGRTGPAPRCNSGAAYGSPGDRQGDRSAMSSCGA